MESHEEKIDVGGFAAVINSRLAAEARIARAISFGWLCAGLAIFACLAGLGFTSAVYGFSYMYSVQPAAEQTMQALVHALERAQLKTIVSGTMSLHPNSELKLAAGQTVRLEEGAIVALDPKSSVRVISDLKVDMPQPSRQQLQVDTTSKSDELPFTNYTIFRNVGFATGEVVTGWNYELTDPQRPRSQHCYFQENVQQGLALTYPIAFDGSPRRPSPLAKLAFDFDKALANCMWFSGV